ncbi:MAG TPA: tetratricopeptide repeat protein [Planktothrix sp.]|jgi:tetratricopeptide (TPR) repeat protein
MKFWNERGSVNNIGKLAAFARKRGDLAQAKSLYACLIGMIKKESGPESENLALNFFRLAETYSDEGNYQAAQTFYRRAAEIWEKTHPDRSANPIWYSKAIGEMQREAEQEDVEREEGDSKQGAA